MYVIKQPNGVTVPSGNIPSDNIDWAAAAPGGRVTFLPQGLSEVTAWINALATVEVTPADGDTPAVTGSRPAGNTIDLDPDGHVLLLDAQGEPQDILTGTVIQ